MAKCSMDVGPEKITFSSPLFTDHPGVTKLLSTQPVVFEQIACSSTLVSSK